jgi:hypothetical protein
MITKTQLIISLDVPFENLMLDQVVDDILFVEKVQKGLTESEKV